MKIAAIALSLFVAGTAATNRFLDFVEESRFLQEANVTVAYNASLQCGQCIRGGFIGCVKGTNFKCCDTVACVDADKTFTCTNKVKSQFNRLYSTCNRVQSNAVCGKSFINLEAVGNNDKVDISNLTAGASCAYKVFSKCGFPAFDINATNIDVTVISQAGKDSTSDMGENDTFSGNEAAVVRPKNGKIDFVFNGTSTKDAECGKMRKMFVVITNIPATTGRIL